MTTTPERRTMKQLTEEFGRPSADLSQLTDRHLFAKGFETPRTRGYNAGLNGVAQSECPFPSRTLDAAEWLEGWSAGDPTAP